MRPWVRDVPVSLFIGLALTVAATACADRSAQQGAPVEPTSAPQESRALQPAIDASRLLADIEYLADDQLQGRDSRNVAMITTAARYIADSHRAAGLQPVGGDYLIPFDLRVASKPGDDQHFWIERPDASIQVPAEAFVSVRADTDGRPVLAPMVFVFKPSAPVKSRVSGKVAVVIADPNAEAAALVRTLRPVVDAGAAALVVVPPSADAELPDRDTMRPVADGLQRPLVVMQRARADEFLTAQQDIATAGKKDPSLGDASVALTPVQVDVTEPVPNVLAVLPGSDLAHEIVVLGAHYDHIGNEQDGVFCRDPARGDEGGDEICNGADDNASGTAMVMELARALAEARVTPRRTLVFAHFAGEELGLLGSEALLHELPDKPPFVEGRVVAMLNMDMVGRYRPDPGLSIGGLRSSGAWRPLLESIDSRGLQVVLDDEVNARSDHASFYRKNIPVLFFFTGLHDDYHRTSDETSLLSTDAIGKIAEIVLDTTVALADGADIPFTSQTDSP